MDIVTFFAHWPNGELTLSSTQNLDGDLKRIIMHRGHDFFFNFNYMLTILESSHIHTHDTSDRSDKFTSLVLISRFTRAKHCVHTLMNTHYA